MTTLEKEYMSLRNGYKNKLLFSHLGEMNRSLNF